MHGDHNRCLYVRGESERSSWLEVFQRAATTVPFDEAYTLGREMGSGRFSKVYEATSTTSGEEFAVKMINKADLNEVTPVPCAMCPG